MSLIFLLRNEPHPASIEILVAILVRLTRGGILASTFGAFMHLLEAALHANRLLPEHADATSPRY
jgi:hypothetical protein